MIKLSGISYQDITKNDHLREEIINECHQIKRMTYYKGVLTIHSHSRITTFQPLSVGDHKTIVIQSKDKQNHVMAFWMNIPELRTLGKAIYLYKHTK